MKMKKQEILKRVQQFLIEINVASEDDFEENLFDFSNYNKPYYLYMDIERCGCFESRSSFMSKDKVNDIIEDQLQGGQNAWDHIYIFDINQNKQIIPRL